MDTDKGEKQKGCKWSIRVYDPQVVGVNYREVAHDGKSLYYYSAPDPPPPGSRIVNSGTATIETGTVPKENGTLANILWAGLASG